MASGQRWSKEELLIAFRLYNYLPFGKLDHRNPEIIRLSGLIGRTPSALSMKACNFASLDPAHQARNVKGLRNASKADRELWQAFRERPDDVVLACEESYERLIEHEGLTNTNVETRPTGPSEVPREIQQRRLQSWFRSAVLTGYENRCALTGIDIPALLNASHIIPWSANETRRADPCNGIALNTLHDRAFDRGLITFDESHRMILSPNTSNATTAKAFKEMFVALEGSKLHLPHRYFPDPNALAYHREHVFQS